MTRLTHALLGNAAFSGLCALVLLAAGPAIAAGAGLPGWALRVTGLALLGFVALLLYGVLGPQTRTVGRLAVWLDWAWVVGSGAALLLPLTASGRLGVAVIAALVAGFALWQRRGLSSLGQG